MYSYAIDERLGLLVGRHHVGGRSAMPDIVRAMRELSSAPGVPRTVKAYFLWIDPDAAHPNAQERQQLADCWRTFEGGLVMAMATTSVIARATFNLISLLRGRDKGEGSRSAFASRDEALAWMETQRPGIRSDLLRLDARRAAQHEASTLRASLPPRTSLRASVRAERTT